MRLIVNGVISVQRTVMYQGKLPLEQGGLRCVLCHQEWWPRSPGSNETYGPSAHIHEASTQCPFQFEKTRRLACDDLDF